MWTTTASKALLPLIFLLVINLIQAYFTPLIDDEAYYWMWAQQLDWGYFDHPPMVALWIKVGFSLFKNELGLRLVTVLLNTSSLYLLFLILKPATARHHRLYWLLTLSFVFVHVYGFITTPDAPLFFFVILYFYLLQNFLKQKTGQRALLLAFAMAGLMYSKYHAALVIAFSLIPLLPALVGSIWFYVACGLGAALYVPHMFWQFEHDFVSFNYHIVRRNVHNHFELSNTADYLLICLLVTSPLLSFFTYKALIKYRPKDLFERSLKWTFWGVILFFLLTTLKRYIQAQWIMVAIIPMICLSYIYYKERPEHKKWIQPLALVTLCLLMIARLYVLIPNPPFKTKYHGWEAFMQELGAKTKGIAVFDSYQAPSLFSFYNFPDKRALRIRGMEERGSQFDLWNSHAQLDGETITYISGHINECEDSVLLQSEESRMHYLSHLDHAHMGANLLIRHQELSSSDSSFRVSYLFDQNISSSIAFKLLITDEPYSFRRLSMISPNNSEQKELIFDFAASELPANAGYAYLVIDNNSLPLIKIGEGIKINF